MHSAPALSYPLGRSTLHAGLIIGLLSVAAVVLATWVRIGVAPQSLFAGILLLWLLTAALAWQDWWHAPTGQLVWDSSQWRLHLSGSERPVRPFVVLDFQQHLLLRLYPMHGTRQSWVWLERKRQPETWLPLRRALFARPGAPDLAVAPP